MNSFLVFAPLGTIGNLYSLILAPPSGAYLNWHMRFSRKGIHFSKNNLATQK